MQTADVLSKPASGNLEDVQTDRIPVEMEIPVPWFPIPERGNRARWMFVQLCTALSRRHVTINMTPMNSHVLYAPRTAPKGGIMLSYHSFGDEPNVWRIKESPIAGWYTFDPNGFSGWSSLALHPERHARFIETLDTDACHRMSQAVREQLRRKNTSGYKQSGESFQVSRPYVYFPLQKIDDPVAQFYRMDAMDVLRRAAEIADRTGTLLVVKRHPLCDSAAVAETIKEVSATFKNVLFSDASIHHHLEGCRTVLVANSGVGLEALLYGKPVFTFSAGEYELATTPISTLDEIELAFAANPADNSDRAARFIAYYLDRCCFHISDPASVERRIDEALSMITTAGHEKPRDFQAELMAVHREAERTRRKLVKSQAEFAALKQVAERALKLASRTVAEEKPVTATESNPAAIEAGRNTAAALYKAGLALDNTEAALTANLREAYASYAGLALELREDRRLAPVVDRELLDPVYVPDSPPATSRNKSDSWNERLSALRGAIGGPGRSTVIQIGCGNGRFLHSIAGNAGRIIGLDAQRSPDLRTLPGNAEFLQADILQDPLPQGDICCSAGVLDHVEPENLPALVARLHKSAAINYHVIACHYIGQGHNAILHPGQWLGLFQSNDPAYRLADVSTFPASSDQLICTVTNLPQGASGSASRLAGTWVTGSGQQVTLCDDHTIRIQDQVAATWFPTGETSAAANWTSSAMIDLLQLTGDGDTLNILNLDGETYEVKRLK